jgi:hypothetical protein
VNSPSLACPRIHPGADAAALRSSQSSSSRMRAVAIAIDVSAAPQ